MQSLWLSVPISFLNLQNRYAVLLLINGTSYLKVLGGNPLQSQVMLLLENYSNGILIVKVFWGLWLLPFGYLVYKSGFLPKILGILLVAGGLGYLIDVTGRTIIPSYSAAAIAQYVTLPAALGEIGTCLWLLILGIKTSPQASINNRHSIPTSNNAFGVFIPAVLTSKAPARLQRRRGLFLLYGGRVKATSFASSRLPRPARCQLP
ncbi:DUF4386 domain-containing protein [Hymenobacter montanus]|uniref:DUF4386 domain-containing protein n=1 Tax=Hymenobacter montanus TaxID=2771359 RepID=UPI0021D111CD|nr:DUF4386 domain-containing protein [Hymenobacter montanus]